MFEFTQITRDVFKLVLFSKVFRKAEHCGTKAETLKTYLGGK